MLRIIRLTLATVFYVCLTLLFLDFTGITHTWLGWMAKIQFLPAVLALNVAVVAALLLLTVLFGRIYCSVICPLGVFQDVVAGVSRLFQSKKKRKMPYSYSPAMNTLRYSVLGVFVAAMIAGIGSVVALLAPYSSYGRMVSNLLQPLYRWGNNLLAAVAERYDSYAFYEADVWLKSLPTFLIAVATLLLIVFLAARNGRTYCNTICPVGTVLGFVSRFSIFRISIDTDKCKNCGMCARQCKASCIDAKAHTVDLSRCVACGNCLNHCSFGALSYKPSMPTKASAFPKAPLAAQTAKATDKPEANGKPASPTLRTFLSTITVGAATALLHGQNIPEATDKKVDGGLAELKPRKRPNRRTPIYPPGAASARNMTNHCTGCQLCVSACPNEVLRPSTSLVTLMQPEMGFDHGYCRPECVKCSEVCPAGAIKPLDVATKSAVHIGRAVLRRNHCIVLSEGQDCGNCARHCPTGAITMVPIQENNPKSKKVPVVNEDLCIGCGACEHLCPARPIPAICVEGYQVHRID